ncbi:helix-turn-helix transcriptional regulator [Kineococcus rubinsiae]|uniref:helix-turn-helix transcriptional regulator n=1 Tax=Kineococcus rubinsiae TaxID=2609562 RepID=UPI0014307002|nr:WYL domain-containing protein [Kineococcus rubinsiae]NIZ92847.1 WYL domain-containing protein [Kineococcus rubinsiae]
MAATSTRTLTLLSLLQGRRTWSGPQLAARLGVSTRTLRRDVEALRGLGYPVSASRGPAGTYRLGTGGTLPPLVFDDEQAVAVALALQTAPVPVAGLGDAAPRALATLRQVMPAHLRARVDAVRVTTVPNAWTFAAPPLDPEVLTAVGDAVSRAHVLRFEVRAADGTRPPPGPGHRVEPHDLVVWAGRWYLVAYDLDAHGWVVHRVDRLRAGGPTGTPFTRRELPGGSAAEVVRSRADRGDTPAAWQCLGTVVMALPVDLVARWAPGGSVVEDAGPGRCRFTVGAWSWAGIAGILATFDADVSEVEPEPLRRAVRELAARFARA